MSKEFKNCCFCGKIINGYGNNPWPANNDEDQRCCDTCNRKIVLPMRIAMMYNKKGDK